MIQIHIKPLIVLLAVISSTQYASAERIAFQTTWAAFPVNDNGTSSALSVRTDGSSSFGIMFPVNASCTPLIILSANVRTKYMAPEFMDVPIEIQIDKNDIWEINSARVGISNYRMETIIPIGKNSDLIKELNNGNDVKIRIEKSNTLKESLKGSSKAIKKALNYCLSKSNN